MKLAQLILFVITPAFLIAQKKDSLPPHVYAWSDLKIIKEDTRMRRQVMDGSTTSLANFEVHASTLAPGKAPHPPHVHADMDEIMIVKEGQVKITVNGISKILGRGSVAFAMAGDEHGVENAGDMQATYYVFKYKGKLPTNQERGKQNGGSFIINWNDVAVEKTGKGHRRGFFNKPISQLEKLEMHTTALNAGLDSHPQHTHKEEEIILLLKGNVQMHIGKEFFNVASGDVVFLPSLVPHNLLNTGKEQCEYFAFQWRD